MLAIEESASIFWAREMRGTISIATTVEPFFAADFSSLSFAAGLMNEISVCPSLNRFTSASFGARTLATTSAVFQRAAAVLAISTPAAA